MSVAADLHCLFKGLTLAISLEGVHQAEIGAQAILAGWSARLIAQADRPDDTYPALTALVDRIRDDSDIHRVEQVMSHSPWSERTTQRVFRRYVGVPVKWVLCRYRLQNAALEIETGPELDFAELAVRLGWYDQAHFINDFRAMLGTTPGEYAAKYGPRS